MPPAPITATVLGMVVMTTACPRSTCQTPQDLGRLLAQLRHEHPHQRQAAARGLGQLRDRRAIGPLTAALVDVSRQVREDAVAALQELRALDPLIGALRDDELRLQVVQVLGQIRDRKAVPALLACLDDGDAVVRCVAIQALQRMGDPRAIRPLVAHRDADSAAIAAAAIALDGLGWQPANTGERARWLVAQGQWDRARTLGPPAIEPLVEALGRTDAPARKAAAAALDGLGWRPAAAAARARYLIACGRWDEVVAIGGAAADALFDAARKRDDPGRTAVVQALKRIGKPAIQRAVALLADADWHVRGHAVQVLGALRTASALAPLADACRDVHPFVRGWAVDGLCALGGRRALEHVRAAVRDAHPEVRVLAVESLGKLGDPQAARGVIPALVDGDPQVRLTALMALHRLGGLSVEQVVTALADPDHQVRAGAAELAGQLGDRRAVQPLTTALADRSGRVRMQAAASLARLGWRPANREQEARRILASEMKLAQMLEKLAALGPAAVTPLVEVLAHGRWRMRCVAANALGMIGPAAKPAIPALRKALYDDHPQVRGFAELALRRIGARGPLIPLERLISQLQTGGLDERCDAAARLGRAGDSRSVKPLITALDDRDGAVRAAAARSLGQIRDLRAVLPLTMRLQDEDVSVVLCAADALGALGDPRATPTLVATLRDPRHGARSAAARALLQLEWKPPNDVERAYFLVGYRQWGELPKLGRSALAPLLLAAVDQDTTIAESAIRLLPELRDPQVAPVLWTALRRRHVGRVAARALEPLGDPRSVEPLIQALANGLASPEAIQVLGRLGDPRAVEPLLHVSQYQDYIRAARSALQGIGKPAVVPLARHLRAGAVGVRRRAAAALGDIGAAASLAIRDLEQAAGDDDAEVRALATAALASIRKDQPSSLAEYWRVEQLLLPGVAAVERNTAVLQELLARAAQGAAGPEMQGYLQARLLQIRGKTAEAAAKYEELVAAKPPAAAPRLRLIECLRVVRSPVEAEQRLIAFLRSAPQERRPLWDAWCALSFVDLGRTPRETSAALRNAGGLPHGYHRAHVQTWLEDLDRGVPLRVNCGGRKYTDQAGAVWRTPRFVHSGRPSIHRDQPIRRTADDRLYLTETSFPPQSSAPRGCRVPLPPGRYRITLHFAEIFLRQPGRRQFHVLVEGEALLRGYSPPIDMAEAFTCERRVVDGMLDIEFVHLRDNPKLAAFEVHALR